MPKGKNQKLKLLYLAKIMQEETDEKHRLTMPQIIEKLEAYGIEGQRKTLYDDLAILDDYGIEIIKVQEGKKTYYYAGSRDFEIAELKFLVDAIQSSKFITPHKTEELIKKMGSLVSNYDAKLLKRQVYVTDRVKSMNESIYYSIDEIHNAINENKQITFKYFSWNKKGEPELRHDGKTYQVSPWGLVWDDENYYLIAYVDEEKCLKHYRVDKMLNLTMIDEKRQGAKLYDKQNKATYTKKHFGMYHGEEESVTLECTNDMANVIMDRFGRNLSIHPLGEDKFRVKVDVVVSDHFLGWIIALPDVTIVAPDNVREQMHEIGKRLLKEYSE